MSTATTSGPSAVTLQIRLAQEARKSKINYGIAMMVFIAIMALVAQLVDTIDWQYQGYGFVVWIVLAGQLFFGWMSAATMSWQIKKDAHYIPIDKFAGRLGRYSASQVKAWVQEIGAQAGFKPSDYAIYLKDDPSENAFAAGTGSGRVIALHTGLFRTMSESDIKGIVAHEFGHLAHNDIFMLIFTMSAIMTFVIVGKLIFKLVLYGGGARSKSSKKSDTGLLGLGILLAAGLLVVFGYLFAPMLSAFMSRKREDLADAHAVLLGYGDGLKSALAKLGGGVKTQSSSPTMAALYINAPLESRLEALFSTHPPLPSRCARIGELLSGNEGAVPDAIESLLMGMLKWLLIPAVGALWISLSQKADDLPGLWGVPYAYFAAVAWLHTVDAFMGSTGKVAGSGSNGKVTLGVSLIAFALLFLYWGTGFAAIHFSAGLGSNFAFAPFATYMMYLWGAKPVIAALGSKSGLLGLLSDIVNFVSIGYAVLIIVSILSMTF